MKKDKGVTLVSLVVYVIVMTIVIGVMSTIISNFYKNTTTVQGSIGEIIEFNKLNNYFLKEVKSYNNSVDSVSENYILFSSGNSFSISGDKIYYNNMPVCNGVKSMILFLGKDIDKDGSVDEENNTIINIKIEFENFKKSISYKVENIY